MQKEHVSGAIIAILCAAFVATHARADEAPAPARVRDLLWVWGNPGMGKPGEHTAATFAQAPSAERARILGVPNVVMAGAGLPHDRALAEKLTAEVAHAPRLVWEIMADGDAEHSAKFVYRQRIADLAVVARKFPQIEAILIDDMTSVAASKGFRPQHLKNIKQLLEQHRLPQKLWGVVYTMNLPKDTTDPLARELDGIQLWHWHARDTAKMEQYVAECEKRYPGTPIVLGLYLHDYGGGRNMPLDIHRRQCETALKLIHEKRAVGIVFLTINNNESIVQWTADWVKRVGGQEIKGLTETIPR